jgi:glycosyltransferase involved in cell wall biosynthesis
MTPVAAVLTPLYCESKTRFSLFRRAVESVRMQSPRVLHVVVDDGSTLPMARIFLERLTMTDDSTVVVRRQQNGGVGAALRSGMRCLSATTADRDGACGQAVALESVGNISAVTVLHSDDLLPDRQSVACRVARLSQDVAMVHSAMDVAWSDGRVSRHEGASDVFDLSRTFHEIFWSGRHIAYPTMLWRRDLAEEFISLIDEKLSYGEDKLLALLSYQWALSRRMRVEYLADVTVAKLLHRDSVSGSSAKWDIEYRLVQDRLIYSRLANGDHLDRAMKARRLHYAGKVAERGEP